MVRVHSDGVGGRRMTTWACSRQSAAPQEEHRALALLVALALSALHSKQFIAITLIDLWSFLRYGCGQSTGIAMMLS